jgi:hypothetical protein
MALPSDASVYSNLTNIGTNGVATNGVATNMPSSIVAG